MDTRVAAMAAIRMLFGLISLSGGYLMLRFNDLQQAVRINGIIGSIGPVVLLLVSAIGVAGLATQMEMKKIVLLVAGIVLILLGTR